MKGGAGLEVQPDGSHLLRLSTPRGVVSVLLYIITGALSLVLWSVILGSAASSRSPLPGALVATAVVCSIMFVAILVDRAMARKRGLKVRFVRGDDGVGYELVRSGEVLQRNSLDAGRLCVAPLRLGGQAGRVVLPIYALLLTVDEAVAGYAVRTASATALVLIRSSEIDVLERKVDELCSTLGLQMSESVRYSAQHGTVRSHPLC